MTPLHRSGPAPYDKRVPRLESGKSIEQIFSTDRYLYKISATFDVLYRCEIYRDPNGYSTIRRNSLKKFRRVAYEELPTQEFTEEGEAERWNFMGANYKLYQLVNKWAKRRIGYKIVRIEQISLFRVEETAPMYYMCESR